MLWRCQSMHSLFLFISRVYIAADRSTHAFIFHNSRISWTGASTCETESWVITHLPYPPLLSHSGAGPFSFTPKIYMVSQARPHPHTIAGPFLLLPSYLLCVLRSIQSLACCCLGARRRPPRLQTAKKTMQSPTHMLAMAMPLS